MQNGAETSITFVVVTHNSESVIGACIEAIDRTVPNGRILIIDNNSDDETKRIALGSAGGAQVISLDSNEGFGRACNEGARIAETPFLAFVNPDCVVQSLDLEELAQIEKHGPVGLLAPSVSEVNGHSRYLVNPAPRPWPHTWRHILGPLRPSWAPSVAWGNKVVGRANWVGGAFFLVSRKEFLDIGGFDPAFFLYYEDTELGHRYCDAGFQIQRLRSADGMHMVGRSSDRSGQGARFMVWSILGWLEFMCTMHQEFRVRRHARTIKIGYLVIGSALSITTRLLPIDSVKRKTAQYAEVSAALKLAEHGPIDVGSLLENRFYDRALRILQTSGRLVP